MTQDVYGYLLIAVIVALTLYSWVEMRRATAKNDMRRRKGWLVALSLCVTLLIPSIISRLIDVEKHQDAFIGIMFCCAIIASLVARSKGNRGSNGKGKNGKGGQR